VDSDGKVNFGAIATQGHRSGRNVQHSFKDLVPLAHRTAFDEKSRLMERPSEEEVAETTARTKAALENLVNTKIKAANPKYVSDTKRHESYMRYTPGGPGADGTSQRIIKMVDVVEDPLEPPKFKHKKVPRGPPSPPAPILRSPPRKVTAQEQKDWMIPPCVSNWKNNKGFTIALDKRLAADGRGLQDVRRPEHWHHTSRKLMTRRQTVINDKFAVFSESLFAADRAAREEVKLRAQMMQRNAAKEKEAKEEALRQLAQAARESGGAPRREIGAGEATDGGPLIGYGGDQSEEEEEEEEEMNEAAQDRAEARADKRRERERELRMNNMGTETRARVLARFVQISFVHLAPTENLQKSSEPGHFRKGRSRLRQTDDFERVHARLATVQ